jgi:hypothetical protein
VLRSFSAFTKATQHFVGVVDRELAYEHGNYAIESNVEEFLSSQNYEMTEDEGSTHITLSKAVGDSLVQVNFFARPSELVLLASQAEQDEEDESDDSIDSNTTIFNVKVKNKVTGQGFLANCFYASNKFTLNQLAVAHDVDSLPAFDPNPHCDEFPGPNLHELDKVRPMQELVTALKDCLEDLVDMPNLLKFIEKYAKDKEQRLYMSWLSDTREFFKSSRDTAE